MRVKGRGLVLALFILAFGGLLIGGGFSKYADQNSCTPGKATVSSCTTAHNTEYVHTASTCTGHWTTGGSLLAGGHVGVGRIEGADKSDEGKTIDVRIHGTDHATVPDLKTPILLWVLGAALVLFGL